MYVVHVGPGTLCVCQRVSRTSIMYIYIKLNGFVVQFYSFYSISFLFAYNNSSTLADDNVTRFAPNRTRILHLHPTHAAGDSDVRACHIQTRIQISGRLMKFELMQANIVGGHTEDARNNCVRWRLLTYFMPSAIEKTEQVSHRQQKRKSQVGERREEGTKLKCPHCSRTLILLGFCPMFLACARLCAHKHN